MIGCGHIGLWRRGGGGESAPTPPSEPLSAPPASADYVMAYDVTNGVSLYEKAADTVSASNEAASLVKLASAKVTTNAIAGGALALTDTTTVQAAELASGTTASLQDGDVISVEDLLYGLMLPSGNDAAETLARFVGDQLDAQDSQGGGRARFVSEMNALAASVGATNTTLQSPHGIEFDATGPNTNSNTTTARDITLIAEAAFADATVRTITGTKSRTITITGANARTYSVTHTSALIRGPFNNQSSEISFEGVLASKTGSLGATNAGVIGLWESPNGTEVVITVFSSSSSFNRYLDWHGIAFQIVQDFPYLAHGMAAETDSEFANVVVLAGADTGFADESSYGRTLTDNGATRTTSAIIGTHSFSLDGTDDRIEAADAAELSIGAEDFFIECYFRGAGSEPSTNCVFVSKYDAGNNQREWSLQYAPGSNAVEAFLSTAGNNFTTISTFSVGDPAVFFNGATRHLALRRSGSEVAIYVDGDRAGSTTTLSGALHAGTAKLMIGARQNNGTAATFFLPGTVDEVRVTIGSARQTARKFTPTGRAHPRS